MSSVLLLEYFHAYESAYGTASLSIRSEGCAMLMAVFEDLRRLPDLRVQVALCASAEAELAINAEAVLHVEKSKSLDELVGVVVADPSDADVVLAIAPETGGVLTSLAQNFRRRGFRFLGPRTEVIEACSDKWQTYELLKRRGLPTVPTELATNVDRLTLSSDQKCVVKPRDGAGCEGVFSGKLDDVRTKLGNDTVTLQGSIVQPFVSGLPISVAMIGQGEGHSPLFLPATEQNVEWADSGTQYLGGRIPASLPTSAQSQLQQMCHKIAWALQLEDGYVGIDMLFSDGEFLITDINARLCTAYVGYRAATTHNLMTSMLQTSVGESPAWNPTPLTFTCNGDVATS
ncbi:MAG: ATP-grasp domain-containing protein [Fuerstiella sp.]|nr:ATP-grasp domain-containing protein [Fuerstiella sp.]MCP4855225.1 ATP-grasp domain-containing protein [Fuerstiella sp.]